jgi:hypothetical protein
VDCAGGSFESLTGSINHPPTLVSSRYYYHVTDAIKLEPNLIVLQLADASGSLIALSPCYKDV